MSFGVEDIFGPCELLWWLETEFPEDAAAGLQQIAREALIELARDGLIQLVTWDPATDEQRDLSLIEAQRALSTAAAWDSSLPLGPHVRFMATPAGKQAYATAPFPTV